MKCHFFAVYVLKECSFGLLVTKLYINLWLLLVACIYHQKFVFCLFLALFLWRLDLFGEKYNYNFS